MKGMAEITLLLSLGVFSGQENFPNNPKPVAQALSKSELVELQKHADEAHDTGHVEDEIEYRQRVSQGTWSAFALDPHSINEYDRYGIVMQNDFRLGLLLEGSHRFSEAEAVFRHSRAELASERIAGNDIKSQNEMYLAHVLQREGLQQESGKICSHWKNRIRHVIGRQDSPHFHSIPMSPVYDTPQVETARWDFACGDPGEGFRLIAEQTAAHPHMLATFSVLEDYYDALGDFQKARKAEADGTRAVSGHD